MYDSIIIFPRCVESGVAYLSSNIESITEASNGHSLVVIRLNSQPGLLIKNIYKTYDLILA